MKKLKLTLHSFSPMQVTEIKWFKVKEDLLMKDAKKSLILKEKFVMEMINHL